MLALSVQQPWAWSIFNAAPLKKNIENRNWKTKIRGRVFIHAGLKIDRNAFDFIRHHFPHTNLPCPDSPALKCGGIIGSVEIADCIDRFDNANFYRSPWFQGRYGFVLKNPLAVKFHPCRGMQGFFKTDAQEIPACRLCGCTDDNACTDPHNGGQPCCWLEPDLCSACCIPMASYEEVGRK